MSKKINPYDIVGQCFGQLRVTNYSGYRNKRHYYFCECDCGSEVEILRSSLIYGRSRSCGMCNQPHIEAEGDYYRYFCTNGQSFIFDACDLPIVGNLQCNISDRGYVTYNRKKNLLTHLLLGVDAKAVVDHVNGDPYDNRRANLRVAENKNNWNRVVDSRSCTGYKGIYPDKTRSKFHARICAQGKRVYLGCFNNPEDAARAYDEAARFYFGEFACVNFPLPGEQCCRRNQEESA